MRLMLLLSLMLTVTYPFTAWSATSYNVAAGATATIVEHGICNTVTNSNAKAMMVATNSSTAWTNFLTHIPPNVTTGACGPVFIQEVETVWNATADKTTSSFNVLAGDLLVAYSSSEHGYYAPTAISGGSLTWTKRQEVHIDITWATTTVWTAVVDADKSMTVTFDGPDSSHLFGGNVLIFRNSGGVGASDKANVDGAAPSMNLTTTQANSAIVVLSADWNAANGSTRTWRTNAGSFTEQTYHYESGRYTVYGGYHANAGAVGTYAVGLSAPAAQKYSIVALEVLPVDVTPNAVDWANFNDTSASNAISGFSGSITLQFSLSSVSGGPVFAYKKNSGVWVQFSSSNPGVVSISSGDTIQFRINGPAASTGLITVKNVSDGGATLDTTTATVSTPQGAFVLTSATYDGILGGISGATDKCLTDLTANDWKDKGIYDVSSGKVSAFICDESTCNNLQNSRVYAFARSGTTADGGATFTTNASGNGPQNSTAWNTATYFGTTTYTYWTGRNTGSATVWGGAYPAVGYACQNWTGNGGALFGVFGQSNQTNAARWSQTPAFCNVSRRLICFVNP